MVAEICRIISGKISDLWTPNPDAMVAAVIAFTLLGSKRNRLR
jgi:hypothetical protein